MDPDVRSDGPGVCPRCGMRLVLHVPEMAEYPLEITLSPAAVTPGREVVMTFRISNPEDGRPVTHFEEVHERLMHLFVVSENLEFFAHEHPALQSDGFFRLALKLPLPGLYRLLADFYPRGATPQLVLKTIFAEGASQPARLAPSLIPAKSENLSASLRLDPAQPIAGLEAKLFFTLDPANGLEPYLGAWGHMLAVSDDLIDFLHLHPFLADGGPVIQFNAIFPRPRLYRVWTQFQRQGVVNTVVVTIPVTGI